LTFKKCLNLGIGKHADKLNRISKNATEEYKIELALNKMVKEWADVKLQFLPYKDMGTYIMDKQNEVIQMLDEHILISEQLSQSSFKGIFEEQLTKWEQDLKHIREVIEKWSEFQKYNSAFKNKCLYLYT